MKTYLTEQKLEAILKNIFTGDLIPQFKYKTESFTRKIDYAVVLSKKDKELMSPILSKLQQVNTTHKIVLLIEFDGYTHYTSEKQIDKDLEIGLGTSEWAKLPQYTDTIFFGLRIPYFVQLNQIMTSTWFNTNNDFSDGYPQGFIDKNCYLPECFSANGERRFMQDINNLPSSVAKCIYNSIFNRIEQQHKINYVIRRELFLKLTRYLFPQEYNVYQIAKYLSPDPHKYYKRLPREVYFDVATNSMISTALFGFYKPSKNKEDLKTEILAYENIMYGYEYNNFPKEVVDFYKERGII